MGSGVAVEGRCSDGRGWGTCAAIVRMSGRALCVAGGRGCGGEGSDAHGWAVGWSGGRDGGVDGVIGRGGG